MVGRGVSGGSGGLGSGCGGGCGGSGLGNGGSAGFIVKRLFSMLRSREGLRMIFASAGWFFFLKRLRGECGSGWVGRFTNHATATAEMDLAHEGAASDVPEASFYVAAALTGTVSESLHSCATPFFDLGHWHTQARC